MFMKRWRIRLCRIGLFASVAVATSCIVAIACVLMFDLSFERGPWVGHRLLVLYRDRADFRFAALSPEPIFGLATPRTEAEAQQIYEDWRDGIDLDTRPYLRWLRFPEFDISLWWGIVGAAFFVQTLWVLQRRTRGSGFPIEPLRVSTKG